MTFRFPYQSLADPVPQDAESVHADAWARVQETHHPKPVMRRQFYSSGMDDVLILEYITMDKWHSQEPLKVWGRPPFRREYYGSGFDFSNVPPPELSWEPEFPDFARRRPPIKPQPGAFQENPVAYLMLDNWKGTQPDYLPRAKPRLPGLYVSTVAPDINNLPPILAWQGPLPEFARRHKPRPHGDRTAITEPTLFTATTLDQWHGEQPAILNRVKRRTAGVFGHVTEPTFYVVASLDSWFVQRPERTYRARPRPHGGTVIPVHAGIDSVVAIDCWHGYQPDFARRAKPRPQGERINVGPPSLQTTPLVCSWHGYQQEIINRKKPRPVTSFTAPVESSLMVVASLPSWWVEPTLVYRKPSRAHLPACSVVNTLAANSVVDVGNWVIEAQHVYVAGN